MASMPGTLPYRGILKPELPETINALHCEVCGCWFWEAPYFFGCPYCAEIKQLTDQQEKL